MLRRTAKHEAGHAVVAALLKRRFWRVSILPADQDGSVGCLIPRKYGGQVISGETIPTEIKIVQAGAIAENDGLNLKLFDDDSLAPDMQQALYLANGNVKYLTYLFERTKALLSDPLHKRYVEAVTDEILQRGRLSYVEVRKVIASVKDDINDEFNLKKMGDDV